MPGDHPIRFGYKASAEQFGPTELLEFSVHAEAHGFDAVAVSDHFQPWRHHGGHSPAVLPWMGALGARTERVYMGTSVLTPTLRYQPAVIAQAFATLACLSAGRVFLGVGTVIGGLWQDRVGPRKVGMIAGILYGISYILAGWSAAHHSLMGMYWTYGVMGGIGMGMGYITPVATLVKWFPDMRGLMTGVAVCGYGAGALIMSPIAARTIQSNGVPATMIGLGIVYLILVTGAAMFYANPPAGYAPAGWVPKSAVQLAASKVDFSLRWRKVKTCS